MYDISVTLSEELVHWPGEMGFQLNQSQPKPEVMVSSFTCGAHTGTHIDAPYHFLGHGKKVDELDLKSFYGPARVIDVAGQHVTAQELRQHDLMGVRRLLFRTRNSNRAWYAEAFDPGYAAVAIDAAEFLVDQGIVLLGIDYLSIEPKPSDGSVHRVLLSAGVAILEGLDLSGVEPGDYYLMALPLKVGHGDGTPVRAILLDPAEVQAR